MAPPTWSSENGRVTYDVALTGLTDAGSQTAVPFLVGDSADYPYLRESDGGVREQIDTSGEAGEQSLSGWWYRSQGSFHLGRGVNYFDTASDDSISRRFDDSCGVHVFDPGKVTLLNACSNAVAYSGSGTKTYAVSFSKTNDDTGLVDEEGVLLVKSNFTSHTGVISKVTLVGGVPTETVLAPLPLEDPLNQIYDICTNGVAYYALKDDGIEWGSVAGGHLQTIPFTGMDNIKRGRIAALKDRLVVALQQENESGTTYGSVFDMPTSQTASMPPVVGTIMVPGWRWTGICEGPNAVYLGGYSGDTGRVYAMSLDTSGDVPTLTAPYVMAELPKGEQVTSLISYMATYLVIGTNKGVRVATINPQNTLTMGPLSVETDTPVWGMAAVGDYVYFGGSVTVPNGDVERPGLYKLNLGVDGTDPRSQLGIFPVARDLYAPDAINPRVNQILRVCQFGTTGKIAFTVDNVGLYVEGSSKVPNGYLKTGRIRFDTHEMKNYSYLRLTKEGSGLTVTPYVGQDGAEPNSLLSTTVGTSTSTRIDYEATTDGLPHLDVQYKFVLSGGDGTAFTGYQVRGLPSNVVARNIRLSLLCFPREKTRDGQYVERSTWERIKKIEAAEKRGAPIRYQNLNTGENEIAVIEKVQFIATNVQGYPSDRKDPGGYLLVTLRLVNT